MAAAGAPFSIREYASRARALARPRGGGGGWPFGGDAGALPPVEVRRFRWWEDEAAAADEEEGEVERRMAAKRRKRSVAELFAAVPRVARGKGCEKGKAGKSKLEKGKAKPALTVGVKAKASKKKMMKVPTGIDVKEKVKSNGVKATSIGISQSFQHSLRKRKPKNNISKEKGNQEVSFLLDKRSKKGKRKSILDRYKKSIVNTGEALSICKKQSKTGFRSALDNKDIIFKSNSSCKPKHVTFSDGTDIFRWGTHVPEDNAEQPQLAQTSQRPTLESHDHRNTDEQQLVCQQADAISGAVENASSLSEHAVSAGINRTVPLTKLKDRTVPGNSVDLNHCIETSNGSNCMNSISLRSLSSKLPCEEFNGVGYNLDCDDGLNVERLGEQNNMVSQASFNPANLAAKEISSDRSPLSQRSGSCLYDTSRSTLRENLVANYQLGKVRPDLLRSGKETVGSINSSTGSNKSAGAQATDCASACRNMHFSNDYVGLPINSRGELVKVHPGGTPNSVDTFKRQWLGENFSCPSAFPTIFTPSTCTDRSNLTLHNHHARQIYTVDQSVFHAGPRVTPTEPIASGLGFRQLPNSERTNIHYYTIPSNKYPSTNQHEFPVECRFSGCMGDHSPQQKLLGRQNCCLSQNLGQSTQHNAETTMRLMGKTVALGTSTVQCGGLNNGTPYSNNQTRAEDQFFQGTRTKVFPQLFHGGVVDPTSACRVSDRERQQPSGKASHFSFVPAAASSFGLSTGRLKTNGHNHQPELATANNQYVHPVDRSNEGELGHQQPVTAIQVKRNADDLLLGSMHRRDTQTNAIRNFMEKGPAPHQSGFVTRQFGNVTQRTPASSFAPGHAVQKAPDLTAPTKFTSLRPLPPSVIIPPHVYSAYYAPPPLGSFPAFHPSAPIPYEPSNSSDPGNALFKDWSMRWAMMGPNPEGLEHLRSCKRPAEEDGAPRTLPKKPCTAALKELRMLPFPEKGPAYRGRRPDAQPRDLPVCLDDGPAADLRLGNRESHAAWSNAISTMRPLKLKPGANDALQPSASSSAGKENPWSVLSVTPLPFAVDDPSCTVSTSKARDAEIYEF